MVDIRSATLEDAPRIAELACDLGYTIDADSVRATLDRLHAAAGAVFVAVGNGGINGWVDVHRSELLQSEPFAEVGGLVVDPAVRSRGIGRQLLERAEQWASDNRFPLVRVRSNVARAGAHRFYEGRGFGVEKTSLTFVKRLGRD
jgi:GNAT superfamily N-acetyltransferase